MPTQKHLVENMCLINNHYAFGVSVMIRKVKCRVVVIRNRTLFPTE
jgi:hypothetical protein